MIRPVKEIMKVESPRQNRVLIVDDEIGSRLSLWIALKDDHDVVQVTSAREGLRLLERGDIFDVVLVDYRMPHEDGLEFLARLRRLDQNVSVAMVSAYASLESATGAMRLEAFDYIEKPFEKEHLRAVVARGIQRTVNRRAAEARHEIEHTAAELMHDLSSPLTAMAFAAEAIASDSASSSANILVESATKCQQLMYIWHNRLAGNKTYDWYFIRDIVSSFQKHINKQNFPVRVRFGTVPDNVRIWVDKNQFLRVMDNVMENAVFAVLHSEGGLAGGISITTTVDVKSRLTVEIKDTGCGMNEETLAKVFNPYYTTKGIHGTGLGLAICKRIMQELEGEIDLQSQAGQGTTVRLTVKASVVEAGPAQA
jgi:signal transduction histidine kinase